MISWARLILGSSLAINGNALLFCGAASQRDQRGQVTLSASPSLLPFPSFPFEPQVCHGAVDTLFPALGPGLSPCDPIHLPSFFLSISEKWMREHLCYLGVSEPSFQS